MRVFAPRVGAINCQCGRVIEPHLGADPHKRHHIALGRRGEDEVATWLVQRGWSVIDRNWRTRYGELDIVAHDESVLAFIEVKTRSSRLFGHPAEAVTATKFARLRRLAGVWLGEHPGFSGFSIRIDVAAVLIDHSHCEIEYICGVGS